MTDIKTGLTAANETLRGMYDEFLLVTERAMEAVDGTAGDLALDVLANPGDRASSERTTQLQEQHKSMRSAVSMFFEEWHQCKTDFQGLCTTTRKQLEYSIRNTLSTARTMALAVHDKDPADDRYKTERMLALKVKGQLDGYREMLAIFDSVFKDVSFC